MKRMYRLKVLALIGLTALCSVVVLLLLAVCIPTFKFPDVDGQLYTIRHQEFRDNNPLFTDLFLNNLKKNNGYLIMGTSESDYYPNGNYSDFLNADTALKCRFSVCAGAGKSASCYFPLFLSNDNVEGLKIIYYINPAYWCNKLARNGHPYFHRYTSITAYRKANQSNDELVNNILKANLKNISFTDRLSDWTEYYIDKARRKYYQDLAFALDTKKFYRRLSWVPDKMSPVHYPYYGTIDSANYNFQYNVAGDFDINTFSFTVDTLSHFRDDELKAMIDVCKTRHIDLTFIIGPYNQIAFANAHPSELPRMANVCNNIKGILEREGVPYIDATDLSSMPGTFNDWQHHSSYGAYLIYLKLKDYVLEKENH